jgi:UDP-N-acetylglucosamine 1-carboxyvinyltransferase
LIPAAILSDDEATIFNVPNISDTKALEEILTKLHCKCQIEGKTIKIETKNIKNAIIEEELSSKLRASYYFMGALLSRFKKVEMFFPGGCKIGARPIDLHLKGFAKMGAKVKVTDKDKYTIEADKLKGARIYLDFASVGATINIMLAATKAEGITYISNAAKEPEIVNVATFLNNMGAKIFGAGTSEIKIIGVEKLSKGMIDVIPDRIEAGTSS